MPAEVRAYLFCVLQGYLAVPSKGVFKETRTIAFSPKQFLSIYLSEKYMLLLWIMVGLTVVVLLILNILLLKKFRTERKLRNAKKKSDKETSFLNNCMAYNLSAREIEVLRLILDGHTYKSAADILFISEKTIDAHLRSIYSKSCVKNKVELVVKFHS